MRQVDTKEELNLAIKEKELLVVYFTGSACGACEVIKQKVESILAQHPSVKGIEVNGAVYPELATEYEVYALPIMLLFVQGKESLRLGRNLDLLDFERKIARYEEMLSTQ